ncbi:hypothetical protein [Xanthobacter wiegelii]|uniref:hypothetical protein n=1 Tax=Xanthobacter wiegelii TaxID=3119913 RepID=UPI00372923DB
MMQDLSFPYRTTRPIMTVLGILAFGAGAYVLFLRSQTNVRGLVLNHIIELSASDASFFYLALAAASVVLCLMGIVILLLSLFANRNIEITSTHLSVPRGILSPNNAIIPWDSITGLRDISMSNHHWLDVFHTGGKVRIAENMLGSEDFATVRQIVLGTVNRVQSRNNIGPCRRRPTR